MKSMRDHAASLGCATDSMLIQVLEGIPNKLVQTRLVHAFWWIPVSSVEDLIAMHRRDLLAIKNLGKTSVDALERSLGERGLKLRGDDDDVRTVAADRERRWLAGYFDARNECEAARICEERIGKPAGAP
jgi:hypothetical protein